MTEVYSEALRQRMLTQTLDNGLQVFVFPKPGLFQKFRHAGDQLRVGGLGV